METKVFTATQGSQFNADILTYDKYIVAFSGGKDSTAAFLHLLDIGVPLHKIELWHHDIDGRGELFMDWECTPAYCQAFAQAFGVPIYFSWKEGGFKREMLRDGALTAPIYFEDENWNVQKVGGTRGKPSTRLKFPQVSPDLSVRWCSAYLKIDVCAAAIRNQERFNGIRTLVISGERGEESKARAGYAIFEPDRADCRGGRLNRVVDRWRPIRDWKEQEVWDIIKRYRVRCHPAYYLGWSRVSCKFCIFGNADQFASANYISPFQGAQIMGYDAKFKTTIKRKEDLPSLIAKGRRYKQTANTRLVREALSLKYTQSIILPLKEKWKLPAGAYGESCGPS
jgi:3'-phosphoadenosine 5'-phosphosulfate sulfotransferase (PAPS reductase)/FAD synthetase